jgi:hypothetical protein
VGNPAYNSGNGEEDGEHVGWEAHGSVDEATVEVNIGVEFATDAKDRECCTSTHQTGQFSLAQLRFQ